MLDTLLTLIELIGILSLFIVMIAVTGAIMVWLGISDPDNSDD